MEESLTLELNAAIRAIEDYPKPGIVFRDISTLLQNARAFRRAVDALVHPYVGIGLDQIAGTEARGFILGGAIAHQLTSGFVPIRKKGKLPYTTVSEKYVLEYGIDEVEIHIDAFEGKENARVLLIDDLIATGGTAVAAASLISQVGAECVESCFIMGLTFLDGIEKLEKKSPVYSVIEVN